MDGAALQRGQERGPAGEEVQEHVRWSEMLDTLQAQHLELRIRLRLESEFGPARVPGGPRVCAGGFAQLFRQGLLRNTPVHSTTVGM